MKAAVTWEKMRFGLSQKRLGLTVAGVLLLTSAWVIGSCRQEEEMAEPGKDAFYEQRQMMVQAQLKLRDVTDERVLAAMGKVPRHEFVPDNVRAEAYTDGPLPIGHGQTISQPYIVAIMTQLAGVRVGSRVLEIGTGSGYQAAVLAEITRQVYTIEIVEPLCRRADSTLAALGYDYVHVKCADGYRGWEEEAPFDAIIVTAAPTHVPQPLVNQLAVGGKLIIPVGDRYQELIEVTRTETGAIEKSVIPVRFVPMTGEAEQ